MREPARAALRAAARWSVFYVVLGAVVGYAFFSDSMFGITLATPASKALFGAVVGFVATLVSVANKYWLGHYDVATEQAEE